MNRSELRRKHFHIFAIITLILAVLFVMRSRARDAEA